MPDTSPEPVTAASEPKPKQPRSAQDKIIAAYIADAKKFLKVASEDSEIRPILEAHGYDDAEFTTASTLATAAAAAFEGRASGMGTQKLTGAALIAAIKAAREDYAAFREIARAAFPTEADRLGLSLKGEVPDDTGRFITTAGASYTAPPRPPSPPNSPNAATPPPASPPSAKTSTTSPAPAAIRTKPSATPSTTPPNATPPTTPSKPS